MKKGNEISFISGHVNNTSKKGYLLICLYFLINERWHLLPATVIFLTSAHWGGTTGRSSYQVMSARNAYVRCTEAMSRKVTVKL